MDLRAILALLFTMLVWGISPVFFRSLSLALGPADHLAIRYALVGLLFTGVLIATRGWRIARADWPRMIFGSLAGFTGYNLGSAFGFERINAYSYFAWLVVLAVTAYRSLDHKREL